MEAKHVPTLRQLLKSTTSETTLLVEARTESFTLDRWDVVTGKQLENSGWHEWKEPDTGEIFLPYGIEITDGVRSKTYIPIPAVIFRFRYASGKVVFSLLDESKTFTDALTSEEFFPFQSNEAWEGDLFYGAVLSFDSHSSYTPVDESAE